ncbi:hypothetical protein BI330_09020 [Mycobacterium sp. CBMA 623]|nr:hypothetical protein [Mycobacteroides sp. CBMA 326]
MAYTADEIRSWGVSPSDVTDIGTKGKQLRGCEWNGNGWSTSQLVVNRPVSEYLDTNVYPGSQPIEIDGLHGAVYWSPPLTRMGCRVVLPSQQAVVSTGVLVIDQEAEALIPDPCQKATDIARHVAPRLPR